MNAKGFKDLSPTGRVWASISILVSVALVVAAERDIHRRPVGQIRGRKEIWRLVCLNALGAVCYFGCGRREAESDPAA